MATFGSLWPLLLHMALYGMLWLRMAPTNIFPRTMTTFSRIIYIFSQGNLIGLLKLLKSWVTILMVLRRCTVKNVIVNTTSASLFGRHFNGTLKVPGSGDLLRYIITSQNAHEAVRLAKKASLSFHGAHLFNLVQSTFDTWLLGRWVSWSMGWMTVLLLFLTNQQYWVDR